MLKWLKDRAQTKLAASQLYAAIVAQSRLPLFYADMGVPDTVTGRFEMIVAHLAPLLGRLGRAGEGGSRLAQAVSEAFIADMDAAMREMGVGDMSVAKKVHAVAGSFFGRLKAYEAALAVPGEAQLSAALARNAFADAPEAAAKSAGELARYLRDCEAELARQSDAELMRGNVRFPVLDQRRSAAVAGGSP
jgi:cytochrome b pre-mRNA-processing protein 3